MKKLLIYYDNPNEASDMYLKWLKKDCEKQGIEYEIVENYTDFYNTIKDNHSAYKVLPMMPVNDRGVIDFLHYKTEWIDNTLLDIDNACGDNEYYVDATAKGIYDHIVEMRPDRSTTIAVIGRGRIGKVLVDMLIDYGYTVCVFNSKSDRIIRMGILNECHIVVGLSAQDDIIDERDINDRLHKKIFIDASHNFNFGGNRTVLRCGKWTREVLLSRLKED